MSEQTGIRADDSYSGRRPTSHERRAGQPWDASYLDRLDRVFETVLDCGLFHAFDTDEQRDYVASLASVTGRGGHLYVLCFSDVGPDTGPHPVSQEELRAAFERGSGWSVASIAADRCQTRFDAQGVPAWLATIERI